MRLTRRIVVGTSLVTGAVLGSELYVLGLLDADLSQDLLAVPLGSLALASTVAAVAIVAGSGAWVRLVLLREQRPLLAGRQPLGAGLPGPHHLTNLALLVVGAIRELGNPINVISGRASLVRSSLPEGELRDSCAIILAQTDRLILIIRRLLDYARPGGTSRQAVDLREVARDAVELSRPVALAAGIRLDVEAPAAAVLVEGNAESLLQAICDLVMNGIHARKGGGAVRVTLSPAAPASPTAVRYARLEVRREVGAEPQGSPATPSPVAELRLPCDVAREHGGYVDLGSDPGQASCITVYLPSLESSCRAVC